MKISSLLSLKRDSNDLEMAKIDHNNFNNTSLHNLKRGITSSSNNSQSNNSQSNSYQIREENKNKYRLRVSFQKGSTLNNEFNQRINRNEPLHLAESHHKSNSEDKFKVYFNKK